ncbi:MAG TPA: FecR domain-containing protein [Gammaproteobacteria bacterium]
MKHSQDKDTLLLQQAARWFTWLHEHKVDPERMEVFQRWCANSESHRRAYEKIESLWHSCDGIDVFDMPWPTDSELYVDTYDGSYSLPLPDHNPLLDDWRPPAAEPRHLKTGEFLLGQAGKKSRRISTASSRKWSRPAVAAACAAAFVLTLIVSQMHGHFFGRAHEDYVTGIAELRHELLEDGSALTVGANSHVAVRFTESSREIVLKRGEAFFEVAKDAGRPFIVSVGGGQVQAVGTAFNINKRDDSVTVSVVEGVVRITRKAFLNEKSESEHAAIRETKVFHEARLEHDQQLTYDDAGQWQAVKNGKLPERATAWRDGRLSYVNESLDAVLQDVNRYTHRKLVLGDKSLGVLTYTGTVFSGEIGEWVQGLQRAFPIKVIETDKQILLLKS